MVSNRDELSVQEDNVAAARTTTVLSSNHSENMHCLHDNSVHLVDESVLCQAIVQSGIEESKIAATNTPSKENNQEPYGLNVESKSKSKRSFSSILDTRKRESLLEEESP